MRCGRRENASYELISRQGDLLRGVVNALKGEPPELTIWSHHDAPELTQAMVAEMTGLRARVLALQNALDDPGQTHTDGCHTWGPKHYSCALRRIEALWNDPAALQHRLMELFQANPPAEASERLINWVAIYSRLTDMPPKELVDLALAHLSDNVTSTHYEQIIEELCTRVWPEWSKQE